MWTFIIITWLELAIPFMNELSMDEDSCIAMESRIRVVFEEFRDKNPEFGFILKCELESH